MPSENPLAPPPENKHSRYVIGGLLIALVLVLGGAYWWYYQQTQKSLVMLIDGVVLPTSPKVPGTVFSTSTAQSLARLYASLQQATSTRQQASIRLTIANVSFAGDPSAGYTQLQSIAANTAYPAAMRALAVQEIGDVYFNRSGQSTVVQGYVFDVAPYSSLLGPQTEPKDAQVWDGMKGVYLYALSLAPSPISAYRVALWYLNAAQGTTTAVKNIAIARAKDYIGIGVVASSEFFASLPQNFAYMQDDANRLQATVNGALGQATADQNLITEATTQFSNTRLHLQQEVTASTPTSRPSKDEYTVELLWTDFNYASFLVALPKTDQRTALINDLLTEIAQKNSPLYGFSRWLNLLRLTTPTVHINAVAKQNIAIFAGMNTAFAQMLTTLPTLPPQFR